MIGRDGLAEALSAYGGRAFPVVIPSGEDVAGSIGMSTLAYFAAHAPITLRDAREEFELRERRVAPTGAALMALLCEMRWKYADAMKEAGEASP